MSSEDWRVTYNNRDMGISMYFKLKRIEGNSKRIIPYLNRIGAKYTNQNGTLLVNFKEKYYYIGLASGKIRLKGNKDWVKFTQKYFENLIK